MEKLSATSEYWDNRSYNRKQWETVINLFLRPVTAVLVQHLSLTEKAHILDVATGTGEPGISIAQAHPAATVTGTDISGKMLEAAMEKAAGKEIRNFNTVCCNAATMPFPDAGFDGVVCRNGIMFFSDISGGLKEMCRVLKPSGKIVVSAWGLLEKNLWISIVLDTITAVTNRKAYNRHIPGMFYCMQPGIMADWFETASLKDIREEEITGIVEFNSTAEHWGYVTDVSADVVNALKDIPPAVQDIIREEVACKIVRHIVHGKLYFQWNMRITVGTRQ